MENIFKLFFPNDRSEIIDLQSKYDDQLEDWKKKCDDKDKEIAALKAEISKLKAEIKRLKERYQYWLHGICSGT